MANFLCLSNEPNWVLGSCSPSWYVKFENVMHITRPQRSLYRVCFYILYAHKMVVKKCPGNVGLGLYDGKQMLY